VTVTTRHPGAKDAVDYKLTRATIDLIPVSSSMCPAASGTPVCLCLNTRSPLEGVRSGCLRLQRCTTTRRGDVATLLSDEGSGVCVTGEGASKVGMIRLSTFNSFSAGTYHVFCRVRLGPHVRWPERSVLSSPMGSPGRGRAEGDRRAEAEGRGGVHH
jgi:hypothetical protein